ncbi:hypothetical protein AHIS2_p040 [Acaryochloris phage A-HIS2]|nr:hypothetical protein AHIS2_p040 [Acaryochloris phage A-HIS2]
MCGDYDCLAWCVHVLVLHVNNPSITRYTGDHKGLTIRITY